MQNLPQKIPEADVGSPSEMNLNDQQVQSSANAPSSRPSVMKCFKLFVVALLLVVLVRSVTNSKGKVVSNAIYETPNSAVSDATKFNFFVYCPFYYHIYLEDININDDSQDEQNEQLRRLRRLSQERNIDPMDTKHTYVVSAKTLPSLSNSSENHLYYCGLTRLWNETNCLKPQMRCSYPGPMFDLIQSETIDVIWVNELDSNHATPLVRDDETSCYNDTDAQSRDKHCTVENNGGLIHTYQSPTGTNHGQTTRINFRNWPISTHIHGLQVRPTFDGNPLSWHTNNNSFGVGYRTINDECYYSKFDGGYRQPVGISPQNQQKYQRLSKGNRYTNTQNPGNLWYHDHSMRSTLYNVASGLAGSYIIRCPAAEQVLPCKQYQKIVYLTTGENQNHNHEQNIQVQAHKGKHSKHATLASSAGAYLTDHGDYYRNKFYRFRFLESDFKNGQYTIRFNDNCDDPHSPNIPFYIIGADSSLMSTPLVESYLQMSPGERLEVLIKFNTTSPNVDRTYICVVVPPEVILGGNPNPRYTHFDIPLKKVVNNHPEPDVDKYANSNWRLPIAPFTDLSLMDPVKDNIKKRMRPLIMYGTFHPKFTVNGHYDFHKGHADNPVIGSTEDWYYINTFFHHSGLEGHPMHVHLINFQVVKNITLRTLNVTAYLGIPFLPDKWALVSTYLIAFDLQVIKRSTSTDQNILFLKDKINNNQISLTQFGSFISLGHIYLNTRTNKNFSYIDVDQIITDQAYNVNVEDQFDSNGVSGIDLYETIKSTAADKAYADIVDASNCPENRANKYYCAEVPIVKPWYRRWKDTVFVNQLTTLVLRIRWTRTDYDESIHKPKGEYFHIPVDHLIEYPGFVAHCHISVHEDSEMMRPYMLQPPQGWRSATSPCLASSWKQKAQCLNRVMQQEGCSYEAMGAR